MITVSGVPLTHMCRVLMLLKIAIWGRSVIDFAVNMS